MSSGSQVGVGFGIHKQQSQDLSSRVDELSNALRHSQNTWIDKKNDLVDHDIGIANEVASNSVINDFENYPTNARN